ncbi:hypothetical protein [Streptomyces luteogriseus]|uniref:hypothetical protein n=1 Tax=Streptomyces luteogriseus TaxID=68233 RepID=UPI00367A6695
MGLFYYLAAVNRLLPRSYLYIAWRTPVEMWRMRTGKPYDRMVLYGAGYQNFITVSAVTVTGAASCLTFAVIDADIRLDGQLKEVYTQELSDGLLVLRISTLFFASAVLIRSFQHLKLGSRSLHRRDWQTEDRLRRMRRYDAQSAMFVGALCLLWLLNANGVESRWTTALSFLFALFCDDWMIISDYVREFGRSPMRSHKLRIRAAYILLLAPLAVITWQQWHWKGAFALLYFISVMLGARMANKKIEAGIEESRPSTLRGDSATYSGW